MCRCLWSEDIFEVCGDSSMQTLMGEDGDVQSPGLGASQGRLQVQSSGGAPRVPDLFESLPFFGFSTKCDTSTQFQSPQFPLLLSLHICEQDTVTTATLRRLSFINPG